jgi:hypothetical protein
MDQGPRMSGVIVKGLMWSLVSWPIVGCGVVGLPIPPEDVGVTPIIERQKKQHAQQAGAQAPAVEPPQEQEPQSNEPRGQDEELPPLRPVGTR